MQTRSRWVRRGLATAVAATMVASLGLVTGAAQADTSPSPASAANPETVSATPLPTVQINGVVWSQAIIGNTVYVGGEFSQARAAGEPADSPNQTPRANLLAYDIRTGNLISSWAPSTNGSVSVIKASADGSRLYIGGNFTTVNGQFQSRLAALNPTSGALITAFKSPKPDARVRAIAVTPDTVYFGGHFGAVGGQTRYRLAAARASDGALLNWAPNSQGGPVWALSASPDRSQVLVGGQFTTMNGSSNPGFGLASVSAATGDNLPWEANNIIRNGGTVGGSASGSITALETDGNSVYAAGFTYLRTGGTLEGVARMSWDGGTVEWVEDCHGDSYGVSIQGEAVYVVNHSHYCGNIPGGFNQPATWEYYRGLAFSKAATQTLRKEIYDYTNFEGNAAPSQLHWFPRIDGGTYTGLDQGAWSITGNGDYLVAGGEFPRVGNLVNQYGLVRFAKKGVAGNPNNSGGVINGAPMNPVVTAPGSGQALVTWRTNWDRDNELLTYRVIRNGATGSPVYQRSVGTKPWSLPYLSFLDTGLAAGTYTYRVTATDPDGNVVQSQPVSVTVSTGGPTLDTYAKAVVADGPMHYWRLDEPSGTDVADTTGLEAATATGGVTRGSAGAIAGNASATFDGTAPGNAANTVAKNGPFSVSVEAWFNTTSSQGGKIVGFGSAQTGNSSRSRNDRHLYLDGDGRVNFGVRQGDRSTAMRVLTSGGGLNDGQWHHVVGTVGEGGMTLYVDGAKVADRTDTWTSGSFVGYWRIGGDRLENWENRPPSDYFTGRIDEVAVYTNVLTAGQVATHFAAATSGNQRPTAAFTAAATGLSAKFASTSNDPDGKVVSYLWDFGDGTTSTQANPTRVYESAGTYDVTLTVTDDDGGTGSTTQPVTVTAATATVLVSDSFERAVTSGWGSAPTGGAWTVSGGSTNFAVGGGAGSITMPTAVSGPRATLGSVQTADTDATVSVSLDKRPNGGGGFVSLASRANSTGTDAYRAKVRVATDGRVTLYLVSVVAGAETTLGSVTLPTSANYVVGTQLQIRLQTVGTSPTTLRAKVWTAGTPEPAAWQLERTSSTASLQSSRGVGLATYLSGSATNNPVVVRFDDLTVVRYSA